MKILNKETIPMIASLKASGLSWSDIAKKLNSEGYKTKQKNTIKPQGLAVMLSRSKPEIKASINVELANYIWNTLSDEKKISLMFEVIKH